MKKIGYILGRRARGDIEPGLDPTTQMPGEIIAPGSRIAGRPTQGLFAQTEDQNYLVGTRRVTLDGVYRYCYTYEAQMAGKGAFNGHQVDGHEMHAGGSAIAAHTAGLTVIALDCADDIEENDLAGGYLVRYVAPAFRCRIKSNLATTVGGIIAITLWDPLPVDIVVNTWIIAYPSIYRRLSEWGTQGGTGAPGEAALTMRAVVCVPPIDVLAEHWFWGQTWGPCTCGAGIMANLIGKTANQRMVHFDGYGWAWYTAVGVELGGMQPAGYLLFSGEDGATPNGDQLYMLQLDP